MNEVGTGQQWPISLKAMMNDDEYSLPLMDHLGVNKTSANVRSS
jgi:hypothetical protein